MGCTLVQVAHQCSFVEPYLGLGGGYVQVTRATGGGPVLLLLPLAGTEFEAWRPLRSACAIAHSRPARSRRAMAPRTIRVKRTRTRARS